MNKKFLKRVAAFALAATMVVGNAAVAMAAGPSTAEGSGSNEGKTPDYPVVSITLPAVTDATMFDYIVDPNGLIAGTASAGADNQHYDWSDFNQSGSLWFQQWASPAAAGLKKFEPTSDKLEVVNNGANDITVKAKVVADANYKGAVTFVTGSTFTTSGKNIYIAAEGSKENVNSGGTALETAAEVAPVAVKGLGTENAADLSFDLIGNKKNFSLAYDKDEGKYIQKMSTGSSLVWSKGSFNLTGACNTRGTDVWGDDELPKLTVTWSWESESTYVLEPQGNGNLRYLFESGAPTGALTAVRINGINRDGQRTNGNIIYSNSTFVVKAAAVSALSLAQGGTSIVATIGGTDYTFTY